MENADATTIWAAVLAAALAFTTLANAVEKIVKARKAVQAPNKKQDERLDTLESEVKDIKAKLANDNDHLESLDEGNRVTQRAILALLDHGIDGNNIEQMQHAKEALQNHLINR